jgi:enoyl-[acyl-carrier protein] reductase I
MTKTALILGVANHRSIAWACAKSFLQQDYRVVFTYQNERFAKTAQDLIAGVESPKLLHAIPCNVENEIPSLFEERLPAILGDDSNQLDLIVHAIAYAPADAMKEGTLLNTSRQSFLHAHDISAYSFLETAQCSLPLMKEGSSLTALSYLGAVRAIPNYNVMGPAKASLEGLVRGLALELPSHRVNAVSAGPINTLAARGISGFGQIRSEMEERAPLKRNVTAKEVADTVRFVASEATGMTGQTIYVDAGYSIAGGPPTSN